MPKLASRLTPAAIEKKPVRSYRYEIADGGQDGLYVCIYPSGRKTYIVRWARGKRLKVADVDRITLTKARERAKEIMEDVEEHGAPIKTLRAKDAETLREFLDGPYREFAKAEFRDKDHVCDRLLAVLERPEGKDGPSSKLPDKKLSAFSQLDFERWRGQRVAAGRSPATVNRETGALRAAMARACRWKFMDSNPLHDVRRKKVDKSSRVRFLEPQEEKRLVDALGDRNDYLRPLVIVALNTGLRRGELFNLRWRDVRLTDDPRLIVEGKGAKSTQTRHIPINQKAAHALRAWRDAADEANIEPGAYVFPNPTTGDRLTTLKRAWGNLMEKAEIQNFRFHDCRHHFASKLAMAGIPLNTIRELLGHSDFQLTMRYAHLAPNVKRDAVEVL